MNSLEKLKKLTEFEPITFTFFNGISNPADFITRVVSYKTLIKSNYLTGPNFLRKRQDHISKPDILTFTVPDLNVTLPSACGLTIAYCEGGKEFSNPWPVEKISKTIRASFCNRNCYKICP